MPYKPRQIACVGIILFYRVTTSSISFARHRAKSDELDFVAYSLFLRVLLLWLAKSFSLSYLTEPYRIICLYV